ncbi:formate dehydrogenase subunit gamma [Aquincola sp. MAHUQ-54]|uniref:Formate dehydrogenase subunit gamma n=1 Tax=Aquincola agrisoli TaxID=3119538 RepID=A0AAW9Q6W2_9BURK
MPSPTYAGDAPRGAPHPETTAIDVVAIRELAARFEHTPGGLLPALHAVQDRYGHIPRDAVPAIAEVFNLSRAEVHGVVTYYHHFRSEPAARHVVQVCRAEACQSMGGNALMAHARLRLGCAADGHHGRSADGRVTLEPVFCLGLCASSPAMSIDGELHARMTPARFDALLAETVAATEAVR